MSKKNKKKKVEEKEQTKSAVETNCKEIKEQDQTINNEKECNKNVYKLEGIINFTDFFEQIIDQNLLKYLKKEIENDRPDCLNIIINSLQPIEKQFFPDLRKKDDNFKRNLLEKIDRQITKLEIMQGFVTNFGTYVDYQYEHYDYLNLNKKKLLNQLEKQIFDLKNNNTFSIKTFIDTFDNFLTQQGNLDDERIKELKKGIEKIIALKYNLDGYTKELKECFEYLYLKAYENKTARLQRLSAEYHKKYFKKARACFFWAFFWFIITSLFTHINLPAGILGWINIDFKHTLEVHDEWLQYIVWITIKTPSIILAWIGLSYLRAADRHDQDAKELSNLHQYKSMITDPVTQDALMVALAPNYFGTKRNRKGDNNFMEKLLLKMIPTLNINAGGGNNNGNNGGQNGGQNP